MEDKFDISMDTMVVTSSFVTEELQPILRVSHEDDDEGGAIWQFHCGNGDFSMEKMQLVKLSTVLRFDPNLERLADLPIGYIATRNTTSDEWIYQKDAG